MSFLLLCVIFLWQNGPVCRASLQKDLALWCRMVFHCFLVDFGIPEKFEVKLFALEEQCCN